MRLAGSHLVLLTLLLWPLVTRAQPLPAQQEVPAAAQASHFLMDEEVGHPFFFEHFTRQDYRQHHQNWAIVQDPRGVIYVANYDGILEYDGASWRLIETPTKTVVRSLAIDAGGVVYAGIQGDLGYLKPDSTGTLRFVSLRGEVPPDHQDFKDVWGTRAAGDATYFQTSDRVFRWDGAAMKVWESERGFHTSFVVRDTFYVRERGVGLLQAIGDSLGLIPDGDRFAELRIYMMAPYAEDRLLIATRGAGLFLYDGREAASFPTEIDALLDQYRLYHGSVLPDGHFALAFLDGGGAVVLDEQGRLVQRFDEATGLLDGWVNYVFGDAQGGLWMALDNDGIVRVDFSSPLSFYDRTLGLEGRVNSVERHQGRLYVATTTGVYVLEEVADRESPGRASFVKVLSGTSRALLSADSVLFVATDYGVFLLRGDDAPVFLAEASTTVFDLQESTVFGRIYIGKEDGLTLLEPASAGWEVHRFGGQINEPILSMAEEADGSLWLSMGGPQVLRLRFLEGVATPKVERFGKEHGLPKGDVVLGSVNGEVFFPSIEGIFRFETPDPGSSAARFYLDPTLHPLTGVSSDPLLSFFVDEARTFWLVYPDRVEIATLQADRSYVREIPPVLRFPKGEFVPIYVEDDGTAWMGDGNRLIRFDPHYKKSYDTAFAALVRKVSSGTGQVIFGGTSGEAGGAMPALDYVHNDPRFEFAAPSYNAVKGNQYQYYLEGRDAGWSGWTYRKSELYYGLNEGRYRFRVRARNAQGVVSEEAVFAFRVLPPWYRTGWAFGLYFVLILATTGFYWRYRSIVEENKRAQEQARELARERLIIERLHEVNDQLNDEIAERKQAEAELEARNAELERFTYTVSHDLKSPLITIKGFLGLLEQDALAGNIDRMKGDIARIGGAADKMARLLGEVLELSRIGRLMNPPEDVDLTALAGEATSLVAGQIAARGVTVEIDPEMPVVQGDRVRLLEVYQNLIDNAVNFMGDQATPRIEVGAQQRDGEVFCYVRDNGIGIDPKYHENVFGLFNRLDADAEGTGIGLALVRRIVEVHGGRIWVESEGKGAGCTFCFSLPEGCA